MQQIQRHSASVGTRIVGLMTIIAIGAVVAFTGLGPILAAAPPVDVWTYHNDNARTGQNLNETILTPANVRVATFGKVGFFAVDGKVDAQPLLLSSLAIPGQGTHDVLYVATEHGTIYGLDAGTGAVLWSRSLLGTGESPSDTRGCSQVVPEIGITATPVIDRSAGPSGVIYVVAMSKNGSTYFQRLHALDVTTGAELAGGPVTVTATGFDPKQYEERAALLLLNGNVILSWTSHCDIDPYKGWVMSYNASTLAQTSVLNVTPTGSRGAFWMAGAGPAADAGGNVYLLAGNGTFDTTLTPGGFPNQGNFGNAFLKLSTGTGLAVADYFATFDTVAKSNADSDLGSGGTLLLPDLLDSSSQVRHLAVGAGKDAHIYVADRDAMGKFNPVNNSNLYQDLPSALPGGVWAMPAYFNNTVYYGSVGSTLKAFSIVNARLVSPAASHSAATFTYPGTTPGVSASGSANGIVWAVENSNPAVLHAYDALDLSNELYNSNQAAGSRDTFGPGNKFITPTIVNGRVYVGTATGVAAFALLGAAPTTVTGVATAITQTGATLGGTANPNGLATTGSFQYGTTTDYGSSTPGQALGAGSSPVSIGGGSIAGLACATPYHFRAVATNSSGTTNGLDAMFTTAACPLPPRPRVDFDGDQKTDPTIYRPSSGLWAVLKSSTNYTTSQTWSWGLSTDLPQPADYDGDGRIDPAIYRPSTGLWAVLKSSTNYTTSVTFSWGASGDVPAVGDFDGDGKADPAVFRPSAGTWIILTSTSNYTSSSTVAWGLSTDLPVQADYDGDGVTDPAIFRASTGLWAVLKSSTNYATSFTVPWGLSTDIAAPGDYDGDGKVDPAVYRPSTGGWYMLQSQTNYSTSAAALWGLSTDVPVPADFDGDRKTDPAIYRPSTGQWAILKSSAGYTSSITMSWGLSTDTPMYKRPQ